MTRIIAIATAAAIAASSMAVPQFALAQSARDYGSGDVCKAEKKSSTTKGTIAGGVIGALVGNAIAGKGNKTEGTIIGGVVGGAVGHQVGKHLVKCAAYPSRVSQTAYSKASCRWVQEYYNNRDHSFEVCRGRDGVWRPSGRA